MEVEIGRGKKGRRAYGLDEVAIVPSRRTRDPEDVDLGWTIGEHSFDIPILASAMDGVVDPSIAIALGKLGGLGVLNLEGIHAVQKVVAVMNAKKVRGVRDLIHRHDLAAIAGIELTHVEAAEITAVLASNEAMFARGAIHGKR